MGGRNIRLVTITAAVDGSSLGNPGPAGWAWVVSDDVWASGGWDSATNNIGELTALLRLLEDSAAAGFAEQPLVVLADSQYVINAVTKWMAGWKRRGWKKADGKPVANQKIMEALDAAMQGRDVTFQWVKGHAGHDLNEAADMRARAAAEAHQSGKRVHAGPGFTNMFGSRTGLKQAADQWTERMDRRTTKEAEPLVAISADQAPSRWEEVLEAAREEPVTITERDKPSLLLLDADVAWRALALLDNFGDTDEGNLF